MPARSTRFVFCSLAISCIVVAWNCGQSTGPTAAQEPAGRPARKLREPGFLFLELSVSDLPEHLNFFGKVAGYKVTQRDNNFAVLETDRGQLLLSGFNFKRVKAGERVPGVEIGLVVGDLDATHAAAAKFGWRITEGIEKQPWGVRDFRVLTPDGYYLRFTE